MNNSDTLLQLHAVLLDLDWAIQQVKRQYPDNPYMMMDVNGRYLLVDALATKGQVLAAIARLEESM